MDGWMLLNIVIRFFLCRGDERWGVRRIVTVWCRETKSGFYFSWSKFSDTGSITSRNIQLLIPWVWEINVTLWFIHSLIVLFLSIVPLYRKDVLRDQYGRLLSTGSIYRHHLTSIPPTFWCRRLGTGHTTLRHSYNAQWSDAFTFTFQGTEMEWPGVRRKFEAPGSEQRCSQSWDHLWHPCGPQCNPASNI